MHLDILNIFNILITPTPSTWCTLQKENALIKLKTWICPIKIFNFNIDVRTLKFILISERYFTGWYFAFVRFLRMTLHLFCSQPNWTPPFPFLLPDPPPIWMSLWSALHSKPFSLSLSYAGIQLLQPLLPDSPPIQMSLCIQLFLPSIDFSFL